MIFGKTRETKLAEEQAITLKMINGIREFAFPLPVRLHTGQFLWLQHYYAYYKGGQHSDGTYFLFSCSRDDDEPYATKSAERDDSLISLNSQCLF